MTITVFGATGMVGKQIVKQALYKGYHVKAFGRNVFTAGFPENENLELLPGALFDEQQVLEAVKGSDAVLSALGGAFDGTDLNRSLGIKNIISQMQNAHINRIIAVGGMGVLPAAAGGYLLDAKDYPPQFRPVGNEHRKAYEYLRDSSLAWTFICCPDIKDAGSTGSWHTASEQAPGPNNYRINAGDLALFMLNELIKNEYVHQRVGISN